MKHSGITIDKLPARCQAEIAAQLYPRRENNPDRGLPDPQPQRDAPAALGTPEPGETASLPRAVVRFVGYRVRPLDPDNFAGSCKDLLDGLRHAGLILGDEPWRILLETEQERVGKFADEKTVIEITIPDELARG